MLEAIIQERNGYMLMIIVEALFQLYRKVNQVKAIMLDLKNFKILIVKKILLKYLKKRVTK